MHAWMKAKAALSWRERKSQSGRKLKWEKMFLFLLHYPFWGTQAHYSKFIRELITKIRAIVGRQRDMKHYHRSSRSSNFLTSPLWISRPVRFRSSAEGTFFSPAASIVAKLTKNWWPSKNPTVFPFNFKSFIASFDLARNASLSFRAWTLFKVKSTSHRELCRGRHGSGDWSRALLTTEKKGEEKLSKFRF